MTERMARELAILLAGEVERNMPASRRWGILATCTDGRFVSIEDAAGWAYRDRRAYEASQIEGDYVGLVESKEWGEWDGSEKWASGLAAVLGSKEYWHSGGGIWLVFYRRPDGRFAVIGSESGAIYASYEEFDADLQGEKGENHHFI